MVILSAKRIRKGHRPIGWICAELQPIERIRQVPVPKGPDVLQAVGVFLRRELGPLADLDGVDLERLGQLGEGPGLLGGLQSDPGLEGRGIALAFARH
jgi:hypothetical protein